MTPELRNTEEINGLSRHRSAARALTAFGCVLPGRMAARARRARDVWLAASERVEAQPEERIAPQPQPWSALASGSIIAHLIARLEELGRPRGRRMNRWGVCPWSRFALQLDAILSFPYGVNVTDWNTFAPGQEVDLDDDGSTAKIVYLREGVVIVRRFFDGSWQNTVWIRQIGGDWGVARELSAVGTRMPDLSAAVSEGILRSREALKKP